MVAEIARPDIALDQLTGRLHKALVVAPATITDVIAHACRRVGAHAPHARDRVNRLVAAGASIDAALALLELEAPQWKLRRLTCDDGEWFCSLSRQPQLPIEFDDMAEGRHENAALAILIALVETRKIAAPAELLAPAAGRPELSPSVLNCDNFA